MENLKAKTKAYIEINKLNVPDLNRFFSDYLKQIQYPFITPELPALVQDYIPAMREFCFVFIGNKFSHAFEKIGDEQNECTFKINHFDFNGKNKCINKVQEILLEFVMNVFNFIPNNKKTKAPYLRLDVFQSTITGEILFTEIEAGVPGLCLTEANKVKAFVDVFASYLNM